MFFFMSERCNFLLVQSRETKMAINNGKCATNNKWLKLQTTLEQFHGLRTAVLTLKNVTLRIITLLLTQYLRNCKKSNLIKFIETVCKQNSESADPVNIYTNDDWSRPILCIIPNIFWKFQQNSKNFELFFCS